jgi:hypothetical protein
VLKEISVQTADSTTATSAAIAKLAELSAGLRRAAAGFRLPGAGSEPAGASGAFRRPDGKGASPAGGVNAATSGSVRQISALGGT